jgi:hypothetical protein
VAQRDENGARSGGGIHLALLETALRPDEERNFPGPRSDSRQVPSQPQAALTFIGHQLETGGRPDRLLKDDRRRNFRLPPAAALLCRLDDDPRPAFCLGGGRLTIPVRLRTRGNDRHKPRDAYLGALLQHEVEPVLPYE